MEKFKKEIDTKNGKLIYTISKGLGIDVYTIEECIKVNGKYSKSYRLSKWDDYGFSGFTIEDNIDEISFEFNINHPLYIPLFHLLNYDKELIIDDDAIKELNMQYMKVYRINNKIYIDFINKLNNKNKPTSERFSIFIKEIGPSVRSKVDAFYKDTKKRLELFFNEVNDILTDYHQISIDEYVIKNNLDNGYKELKKIYKKDYSKKLV